jgi:hypothetical protein
MADNVTITPGTGVAIATDDVGGVQYQRVKLDLGAEGLSAPVVGPIPVSQPGLPVALGAGGGLKAEGIGAGGTPAGGVLTVQGTDAGALRILTNNGLADGTANPRAFVDSGAGLAVPGFVMMATPGAATAPPNVLRTPAVFKPLSAVVITAETTIWTPTAGKKFRLMGYAITQGVATGAITLKDNTAGTTILVIPPNTIGVHQLSPAMGNGILSAAANNVLTATGVVTETITGYVFGTEE